MIEFRFENEKELASPPSALGKQANYPSMSVQQARAEAVSLLASSPHPILFFLVDYLFAGGAMCVFQLGNVSPRTLRRYAKKRVVDRLPFTASTVASRLTELGLTVPEDKTASTLYTLGPVGVEIAKMRHDVTPATGFLAYTLERVLHDVVTNEIVLKMAYAAKKRGWRAEWVSKYETSLMKENHQILEPDAMLRLNKDSDERLYLLEYHNEDKSTRALGKVRKYESARVTGIWSETWQTDVFPPVLAVFRNKIVAKGYQDGVAEQADGGCQFYGRTLGKVLEDVDTWFNFNTKGQENVFPWTVEA